MQPLFIYLLCFNYIRHYSVGAVCGRIVWSFILLWLFHQAQLLFYSYFFLSTEWSSFWVNCPSLMSNCLLIILFIYSCVNFGEFPNKFSKCCFHRCIHSCWLEAFSLTCEVLFLLLTSFTFCHAIRDCLYSTDSLILSIWFCKYYACSFRYM